MMSANVLILRVCTYFRLGYLYASIYWEDDSLSRLESDDILLPQPRGFIISTFHCTFICANFQRNFIYKKDCGSLC